jgi:hypothetical protein
MQLLGSGRSPMGAPVLLQDYSGADFRRSFSTATRFTRSKRWSVGMLESHSVAH